MRDIRSLVRDLKSMESKTRGKAEEEEMRMKSPSMEDVPDV